MDAQCVGAGGGAVVFMPSCEGVAACALGDGNLEAEDEGYEDAIE